MSCIQSGGVFVRHYQSINGTWHDLYFMKRKHSLSLWCLIISLDVLHHHQEHVQNEIHTILLFSLRRASQMFRRMFTMWTPHTIERGFVLKIQIAYTACWFVDIKWNYCHSTSANNFPSTDFLHRSFLLLFHQVKLWNCLFHKWKCCRSFIVVTI